MERKPQVIPWPTGGRSDRYGIQTQPPFTTVGASNVWTDASGRERGGSRPAVVISSGNALSSWIATLHQVSWIDVNAIQTTLISLSSGSGLRKYNGSSWDVAINRSLSQFVASAEFNQKLYFANWDMTPANSAAGYQPFIYDPATHSVSTWTATDGTTPLGCPVICTFRGRLALAGGTTTPYGIFFSRQGDPLDWDYAEEDDGAAVSLAAAFAGQIGETVTAMWPHADNCLIIGCPNSLWMLRGDPKTGQLAAISHDHGIVDKFAFCTTPDGQFVFLSADGLYSIPAGCGQPIPESLSRESLPQELVGNVERSVTGGSGGQFKAVTLAYDVYHRGLLISVTPNGAVAGTDTGSHWFFDWETKSFWPMSFGSGDTFFHPTHAISRRNYVPVSNATASKSETQILFSDGNMRQFDDAYDMDDEVYAYENGTVTDGPEPRRIRSHCIFGPFGDASLLNESLWAELSLVLSDSSTSVDVEIFSGRTAEEASQLAISGPPSWTARINGQRSPRMYPRVRGASLYLKIKANRRWAFEAATAVLAKVGRVRT